MKRLVIMAMAVAMGAAFAHAAPRIVYPLTRITVTCTAVGQCRVGVIVTEQVFPTREACLRSVAALKEDYRTITLPMGATITEFGTDGIGTRMAGGEEIGMRFVCSVSVMEGERR